MQNGNESRQELAKLVRETRKKAGYSQVGLSVILRMTQRQISRIENGTAEFTARQRRKFYEIFAIDPIVLRKAQKESGSPRKIETIPISAKRKRKVSGKIVKTLNRQQSFGTMIQLFRKKQKIGQVQLAVMLGVSQAFVSKVERNKAELPASIWLRFCGIAKLGFAQMRLERQ